MASSSQVKRRRGELKMKINLTAMNCSRPKSDTEPEKNKQSETTRCPNRHIGLASTMMRCHRCHIEYQNYTTFYQHTMNHAYTDFCEVVVKKLSRKSIRSKTRKLKKKLKTQMQTRIKPSKIYQLGQATVENNIILQRVECEDFDKTHAPEKSDNYRYRSVVTNKQEVYAMFVDNDLMVDCNVDEMSPSSTRDVVENREMLQNARNGIKENTILSPESIDTDETMCCTDEDMQDMSELHCKELSPTKHNAEVDLHVSVDEELDSAVNSSNNSETLPEQGNKTFNMFFDKHTKIVEDVGVDVKNLYEELISKIELNQSECTKSIESLLVNNTVAFEPLEKEINDKNGNSSVRSSANYNYYLKDLLSSPSKVVVKSVTVPFVHKPSDSIVSVSSNVDNMQEVPQVTVQHESPIDTDCKSKSTNECTSVTTASLSLSTKSLETAGICITTDACTTTDICTTTDVCKNQMSPLASTDTQINFSSTITTTTTCPSSSDNSNLSNQVLDASVNLNESSAPKSLQNESCSKVTHVLASGYKCSECNKLFATSIELEVHTKNHSGLLTCPFCKHKMNNQSAYKEHIASHDNNKSNSSSDPKELKTQERSIQPIRFQQFPSQIQQSKLQQCQSQLILPKLPRMIQHSPDLRQQFVLQTKLHQNQLNLQQIRPSHIQPQVLQVRPPHFQPQLQQIRPAPILQLQQAVLPHAQTQSPYARSPQIQQARPLYNQPQLHQVRVLHQPNMQQFRPSQNQPNMQQFRPSQNHPQLQQARSSQNQPQLHQARPLHNQPQLQQARQNLQLQLQQARTQVQLQPKLTRQQQIIPQLQLSKLQQQVQAELQKAKVSTQIQQTTQQQISAQLQQQTQLNLLQSGPQQIRPKLQPIGSQQLWSSNQQVKAQQPTLSNASSQTQALGQQSKVHLLQSQQPRQQLVQNLQPRSILLQHPQSRSQLFSNRMQQPYFQSPIHKHAHSKIQQMKYNQPQFQQSIQKNQTPVQRPQQRQTSFQQQQNVTSQYSQNSGHVPELVEIDDDDDDDVQMLPDKHLNTTNSSNKNQGLVIQNVYSAGLTSVSGSLQQETRKTLDEQPNQVTAEIFKNKSITVTPINTTKSTVNPQTTVLRPPMVPTPLLRNSELTITPIKQQCVTNTSKSTLIPAEQNKSMISIVPINQYQQSATASSSNEFIDKSTYPQQQMNLPASSLVPVTSNSVALHCSRTPQSTPPQVLPSGHFQQLLSQTESFFQNSYRQSPITGLNNEHGSSNESLQQGFNELLPANVTFSQQSNTAEVQPAINSSLKLQPQPDSHQVSNSNSNCLPCKLTDPSLFTNSLIPTVSSNSQLNGSSSTLPMQISLLPQALSLTCTGQHQQNLICEPVSKSVNNLQEQQRFDEPLNNFTARNCSQLTEITSVTISTLQRVTVEQSQKPTCEEISHSYMANQTTWPNIQSDQCLLPEEGQGILSSPRLSPPLLSPQSPATKIAQSQILDKKMPSLDMESCTCGICSKDFPNATELSSHLLVHTREQNRNKDNSSPDIIFCSTIAFSPKPEVKQEIRDANDTNVKKIPIVSFDDFNEFNENINNESNDCGLKITSVISISEEQRDQNECIEKNSDASLSDLNIAANIENNENFVESVMQKNEKSPIPSASNFSTETHIDNEDYLHDKNLTDDISMETLTDKSKIELINKDNINIEHLKNFDLEDTSAKEDDNSTNNENCELQFKLINQDHNDGYLRISQPEDTVCNKDTDKSMHIEECETNIEGTSNDPKVECSRSPEMIVTTISKEDDENVNVYKSSSCNDGPFSCLICDKIFSHHYLLRQHMRTHPLKLPLHNSTFSKLRTRKKRNCTYSKKNKCRINACLKSIRTKYLLPHYRVTCTICKKKFGNFKVYVSHQRYCCRPEMKLIYIDREHGCLPAVNSTADNIPATNSKVLAIPVVDLHNVTSNLEKLSSCGVTAFIPLTYNQSTGQSFTSLGIPLINTGIVQTSQLQSIGVVKTIPLESENE